MTRRSSSPTRVAACFSGAQSRKVADAGESIRKYLIRPLKADVLLALCYVARDRCTTVESCRVQERFGALAPFARVSLLRQLTVRELVPKMEGLPHWPEIVRTYNLRSRGLACARNPSWTQKSGLSGTLGARQGCWPSPIGCIGPYNCTGILYGNSIFAPVIGSPNLQSLPMLRGVQQCLETIEAHEAEHAFTYGRVVFSRLEFWWLRPHPPLRLLDPSYVWIPRSAACHPPRAPRRPRPPAPPHPPPHSPPAPPPPPLPLAPPPLHLPLQRRGLLRWHQRPARRAQPLGGGGVPRPLARAAERRDYAVRHGRTRRGRASSAPPRCAPRRTSCP